MGEVYGSKIQMPQQQGVMGSPGAKLGEAFATGGASLAADKLGSKGGQAFSFMNGKSSDSSQFMPSDDSTSGLGMDGSDQIQMPQLGSQYSNAGSQGDMMSAMNRRQKLSGSY